MKYLSSLLHSLLFGLGLLGFTACEKAVEIEPDGTSGLVLASKQFADDRAANDAVVGLYISVYPAPNSTPYTAYLAINAELSANEMYSRDTYPPNRYSLHTLLPTDGPSVLWVDSYRFIYHANAIIENVTKSTGISPDKKNQFIGEAKFIRAFCHFYLVNLFGDVPLVTTTDYRISSALGRTPRAEVYGQIVRDLMEAEEQLPVAYPTEGRVRANRAVAKAMLARVYLYQEEWVKAEAKATELINNGQYVLERNLNTAFQKESKEAIFQFWTKYGYTQFQNNAGFYWDKVRGFKRANYGVTANMINAFEPGDQRKIAFLDTATLDKELVTYPSKYNIQLLRATDDQSVQEYDIVFRLGEQYLIRAEALAQQGKVAEAIQDLDSIRERAGLPGLSASMGKEALLLAIEQERRVELCFEWGHRWLDLKRTKRADAILSKLNTNWRPTAALYPIPQEEIRSNIKLKQNPGY